MTSDDLMLRSTAAFLALAPTMLLIAILCVRKPWCDSRRLIWTAYGLGFSVAIPTAGFVAIYAPFTASIDNFRLYAAAIAFLEAAAPEESAKFLIIYFFVLRHAELRRPADAMILTICMALGFATIENLYYVIGSEDWTGTAMLRAVTAVPMHATIAVVMGYYAAQLLLHPGRHRRYLVQMWIWPFLLHGLYDYPVFAIYRLLEIREIADNAELIEFQTIFVAAFLVAIAAALTSIHAIAGEPDAMQHLVWHDQGQTRRLAWRSRSLDEPGQATGPKRDTPRFSTPNFHNSDR